MVFQGSKSLSDPHPQKKQDLFSAADAQREHIKVPNNASDI